jgi:hypothetical protein
LPDAVPPPAGGAGVVLTGVGLAGVGLTGVDVGAGFAVGFTPADLLGVGVVDALVGPAVVTDAALDEPVPEVALEAAALEAAVVEAGLEIADSADEAAPLALLNALDGVPSGAA